MKKLISVFLALILVSSALPLTMQAFAADPTRFDLPTVYFRGNGEPIVDEEGNTVYDFDVTTDQIKEIMSKKRGQGAIVCTCPQPGILRENVLQIPVWYI